MSAEQARQLHAKEIVYGGRTRSGSSSAAGATPVSPSPIHGGDTAAAAALLSASEEEVEDSNGFVKGKLA
jgi:hypothetical protein